VDDRAGLFIEKDDEIMKKKIGIIAFMDKAINIFELVIAILLMIVVAIKLYDSAAGIAGITALLADVEFEEILSAAFNLVIGVEFVRMLCKHTPETVIDVLLFAIARYLVLSHDGAFSKVFGVIAIAGLFAVKRFLIGKGGGKCFCGRDSDVTGEPDH